MIRTHLEDKTFTVFIEGVFDIETAENVNKELNLVRDEIEDLVLDLEQTSYISPGGKKLIQTLCRSQDYKLSYEHAGYTLQKELEALLKKEMMMEQIYEKDNIELFWITKSRDDAKAFAEMERMHKNYKNGLSAYSKNISYAPLKKPEENEGNSYVLVSVKKDNEYIPVGYFIFSLYPYGFSKHDIFINEFYIKKRYRNKKLGRKVAEFIIKSAETKALDITMFIYEGNTEGKKFWNINFNEHGYHENFLSGDILAKSATNENLRFYYWSKD